MNITYAGINTIVKTHADMMPNATNTPKTCTGGIGVSANDAKPAADVSDVYSIGMNSSSITVTIVFFRSRVA